MLKVYVISIQHASVNDLQIPFINSVHFIKVKHFVLLNPAELDNLWVCGKHYSVCT